MQINYPLKEKRVVMLIWISSAYLSCMLLNIKRGDEVIMPFLTNVADAQVVISGAKINIL